MNEQSAAASSVTIVGYADEFSVQPGQDINFMIDTASQVYTANVVKLCGGMPDPDHSTEVPTKLIPADCAGEYRGRRQTTLAGSYAELALLPEWLQDGVFSVQMWIYPTIPKYDNEQTIWSACSMDCTDYARLSITKDGKLAFSLGAADGKSASVVAERPLLAKEWYFVAVQYSAQNEAVMLFSHRCSGWSQVKELEFHTKKASIDYSSTVTEHVLLAADTDPAAKGRTRYHYNGKISNPRFFGKYFNEHQLSGFAAGRISAADQIDTIADYDFSKDISSTKLWDKSSGGYHGVLRQGGVRGVTSYNWTGEQVDYRLAPEQYAAVHFHDDDVADAGWEVDITWKIPLNLESGTYALQLEADGFVDYIPFYVRPTRGCATAPVLYLAPTNTYLAYANERLFKLAQDYLDDDYVLPAQDVYLDEHAELGSSIYDLHSDGFGVQFSSRLRPIMNFRPNYRNWRAVRHFPADLYITGWLERNGHRYDSVTDEDLHSEGIELLRPYKVIITGSHPEYWTRPMMKALEQYLAEGGRLMYLGGNGFYWVTSLDPDRPYLLEVRRGNAGSRSSDSPPGELFHSTTGEPGGIWRHYGYVPQRLVGVGTTALGGGTASGYKRLEDSFHPAAQFIFEGIGEDEIIGDFGYASGGAAGDEVDRYDLGFGTPQHTLRLATSVALDDNYQFVHEDLLNTMPNQGGSTHPLVRADMTYFDIEGGGAVFSTGSINWAGSLAWNEYDNNVARITENVLKHLLIKENPASTVNSGKI
ncbi:N,N-dimethylformamidase beta subunit family domain-containing protein [Paenibacillus lentus]|uniref:N,N-dimethylformamidase n=1 Tax=Paenibacillus lentus TaxID=1338368 RepID=A0A3Q8SDY5_9BACL|nr:N,N-dimethylformamidase beta subunit family domain-containing protein [Paenibacillus lentus]AZK48501.1 N,N-dimethylformamidase [Paenibacillus lentus]